MFGKFILIFIPGRPGLQKISFVHGVRVYVAAPQGSEMMASFKLWMGNGTDLRIMAVLNNNWTMLIK